MATVLDVARRAGVSSATVSRVLSGGAVVARDTKERVLAAVKELDFRPNQMAQGLRRGRGSSVALLVGDIEQTVYAVLTKHIQPALGEIGLDLLLYNLGHSEERLRHILERASAMRLRGIAIASTDLIPMRTFSPIIRGLVESGITVLSIGQRMHKYGIPSVVHEERTASARAVRYLVDAGRAPVAYIGRIEGSGTGSERFRGYKAALIEAGQPFREELVFDVSYRYAAGHEGIARALDQGVSFRSVQCGSDEIALGAMAAIQDRKLRIPDDIAVIGFGNLEWDAHVRPALTTMSAHPQTIAEKVQEIFRNLEMGRPVPPLSVIERSLVRRQSA